MKITYVGSQNEDEDSVLITGILRGEPTFTFRARDARTLAILLVYRAEVMPLFSPERAARLDSDIVAWKRWQQEHADIVRDPD